jgi:HK97 family phage portal protein
MSPITALGRTLDINNASLNWNKALLDNGARPSGVFYYDDKEGGTLDDDVYDRLKKEITENYTGASNTGRPILLEGGMKWQQMSLTPTDMDYLNGRNMSSKEIAVALEFPPSLLGLAGDNTYNNQKESRLALWTDGIVPLIENLANHLNRWLLPMFDMQDTHEIVPNYDEVGALQPIRDAIWEKAATKGKDFLTINERRKMVGYQKITGMDGVLSNASQVPLTYALEHPSTRAPFVQTDSNVQLNGRSRQTGDNISK